MGYCYLFDCFSACMKKKLKIAFFIFLLLSITVPSIAQPNAYFVHYGTENGLPQHTITDIHQDQKGFMWFSTWDGLSKFDGYTFTTYHLPSLNTIESRTSRIDKIFEDKFNNIWVLTYDNQAFMFDVGTATFVGTSSIQAYQDKMFYANQIIPLESGAVWIISEKHGCISVVDSLFNAVVYNRRSQNLSGDHVYTIHEDRERNTWLLTNQGLTLVPSDGSEPLFYFHPLSESNQKNSIPFFSVLELEQEIWFGSHEGVVWRYNKSDDSFKQLTTGISSDIISLFEISTEKIVMLSDSGGFIIYNTLDGTMELYNKHTLPEVQFNQIVYGYVDRSRNLWLETDLLGVSKFNPFTKEYVHFTTFVESTESSVYLPNFFIFEDRENRLWVHPRGGGFSIYDKATDTLVPFYNDPMSSSWMFSNMMHSAYSDRQGNLWMCTRTHGLEKVLFYDDSTFASIKPSDNFHSTISNEVRPIFEDSLHNIWVGTKDGIIHIYNSEMVEIGILNDRGEIGEGIPLKGIAYCITGDSRQNIWIGTKGEGVYMLTRKNGTNLFDIQHIRHDPNNHYSLSDDNVYSIFEDKNGNIWIATFGGGVNLIRPGEDNQKVIHSRNELTGYPQSQADRARIITSDKHGNICVGTTLGFMMFDPDFTTHQEIDFKIYTRNNTDPRSIGANDIIDIITTKNGETFIGTFGGGISMISETDQHGFPLAFDNFNTSHGLPKNIILSIEEDFTGNLWISSEGNLSKFNRQNQTFETFSEINRLMKRQSFSENGSSHLRDGRLLFGYSGGFFTFDPDHVKNNTYNPYLALVQFRLFNRPIPISSDGPLYRDINLTEQLMLKHNQNFFGIEFAALDYIDPENILYAYKLDGFDKEWIFSSNQRIANYTNLSPGKYLFRVKSTNSDGVWAENERLLAIEVKPPLWATGWAYAIYLFLFLLILYFTYRILFTFYRMRNKIILEKRESEIKTRFFTNISHEIRTPLTMIVSPIENLLTSQNTPATVKNQLMLVSKNTNRLLNMVNQILDFQKMSQLPLTVHRIELAPFVKNLFDGYVKNAEIMKIDYRFVNNAGDALIWADGEALEKIILNLLSNAFKYTPAGRSITVTLYNQANELAVEIRDTGSGISKEKQARLFRRFESFNEDKSKPSTGIGLSIVKELADKHMARISVESEVNQGSCFTLFFKKGIAHLGPEIAIDETIVSGKVTELEEAQNGATAPCEEYTRMNEHPLVLVVEDDDDLRQFIRSILEEDYEVHEASNGVEGYEKAKELMPDFIVSDIMMPEADGMQLLDSVRKNVQTSHILFLLLTAKTTLESKLEGFEQGADEYISKPFSVSFFKARVKSLLQRRNELQNFYRNRVYRSSGMKTGGDVNETTSVNDKDLSFIQSINKFIEEHLGNNDYVIEDLAVEMGMSRSVFFKKVKGLTGLAPVEYVRDVLMQHAAVLLVQDDYSIKEISYMVGMNDAKYFSRCFKNKYRMTPTEYRKLNVLPKPGNQENELG